MGHGLKISPHWLVDQQFSRTRRHTSLLSPAQVVVGGLHVVELAPSQRAQLIERHSWEGAHQRLWLSAAQMIRNNLSKTSHDLKEEKKKKYSFKAKYYRGLRQEGKFRTLVLYSIIIIIILY